MSCAIIMKNLLYLIIVAEQEARQILYLDMCVRFGMQSIPVPAHFAFHAHDGGIFCRQEPAFSASKSSDTELSNAEVVLATHRDLLLKGSVKHDAMSNSLQ